MDSVVSNVLAFSSDAFQVRHCTQRKQLPGKEAGNKMSLTMLLMQFLSVVAPSGKEILRSKRPCFFQQERESRRESLTQRYSHERSTRIQGQNH